MISHCPEPSEVEINLAKKPHDIFLSNLIINHILLFTGIATFGQKYMQFLVIVPVLSVLVLGYTFYKSNRIKQEDSPFIYIHWQIARRWSVLFSAALILLTTVATLGWLANQHLGLMKEAVYALIGGLGILPTLVVVLVLIVIESDSLHHARVGTLPNWARRRFISQQEAS